MFVAGNSPPNVILWAGNDVCDEGLGKKKPRWTADSIDHEVQRFVGLAKWCSNVLVLYANDPDAYPDIDGCNTTWKQRMDQVVAALGQGWLATCSMSGFIR